METRVSLSPATGSLSLSLGRDHLSLDMNRLWTGPVMDIPNMIYNNQNVFFSPQIKNCILDVGEVNLLKWFICKKKGIPTNFNAVMDNGYIF